MNFILAFIVNIHQACFFNCIKLNSSAQSWRDVPNAGCINTENVSTCSIPVLAVCTVAQ